MHNPAPIHHRIMFSDLAGCKTPGLMTIDGREAQHLAKVKRARVGEMVGVLDGKGAMGIGEIAEISGSKQRPIIAILLDRVDMIAPIQPRIEICCPAPKGDRLERMIDQLTQIGVDSWIPLVSKRSERNPDSIRTDRLERVINEACKQCIRARSLRIEQPQTLDQALQATSTDQIIVCDATGESSMITMQFNQPSRVLIGPEGGWSDDERDQFSDSKIQVCRLGAHVLRLESAAVVAGSIALAHAQPPIPINEGFS
ncbi:MAG: 16S rRNA (uracil(1498)-N(3))-methyltransferase [Phycisphaerales bacterium]